MSATRWALQSPARFDFTAPNGTRCRGADQEWYRDSWQRKAGCGPTTAATCLFYLSEGNPALAAIAPPEGRLATKFVSYMEAVWQQVTPTIKGLNSLALYWGGALEFARLRGCHLAYAELAIPGKMGGERPSLAEISDFLREQLSADRPVAFLNFSNGALENLESWHWVPLIWAEAEGDALRCGILDEGLEKTIDLSLWHQTSLRGGGFVALWGEA